MLYASKFWRMMNPRDIDPTIAPRRQRLFLENPTQLQFVLAHDTLDHQQQNWGLWKLVVNNQVHNVEHIHTQEGLKCAIFTHKKKETLRRDGTVVSIDWDTYNIEEDEEWKAHKLLHARPVPQDFRKHNREHPQDPDFHRIFRITVCQTTPIIGFRVTLPDWPPMHVKRWVEITDVVRRCQVRLYSRAGNRAFYTDPYIKSKTGTDEQVRVPLWMRDEKFNFVRESRPSGPVWTTTVQLDEVPVGWAILELWAIDGEENVLTTRKMMQVFVSPRIRVRDLGNGRWRLVSEREIGDDIRTIEGALWKRVDGYFILRTHPDGNVVNPEDRYDPNKIKGYRSDQDVMDSNADEHWLELKSDGNVYCGPDRVSSPCDDLPEHPSERITELELKLEWVGGPDGPELPPVERP